MARYEIVPDSGQNEDLGYEFLPTTTHGARLAHGKPLDVSVWEDLTEPTIRGKHMTISIERILVNAPLVNNDSGCIRHSTLVRVLFQNTWGFVLPTFQTETIHLIDSEGFQHEQGVGFIDSSHYDSILLSGRMQVPCSFNWPSLVLQARAKVRGWLWFEKLSHGITPERISFTVNVFEPGCTSGWLQECEDLIFMFKSYKKLPISEI